MVLMRDMQGLSVNALRELFGHSSEVTTQIHN
jgi:hypothetical protein